MNKHVKEISLLSLAMAILFGFAAWISRLNDTSVSIGAISVIFFSYIGLSLMVPLAVILIGWRMKLILDEIVSTRKGIEDKALSIVEMLVKKEGELDDRGSYTS